MKKNYFKIAAAGVLVFLMVSCGLMFTEITLSSHKLDAGDTLTISTKLERPKGDDYTNNKNMWMYFGVRVPMDWTTEEMLTVVDECAIKTETSGIYNYNFENSDFYAALLELCYPKEGYKWLGYQSKVKAAEIFGEPMTTELVLKVGDAGGKYDLDIMGGCNATDPIQLYYQGQINYDLAFNNFGENNQNLKEFDGVKYVSCSEYLFCATTIGNEEKLARQTALKDIKVKGYPITPNDLINQTSGNVGNDAAKNIDVDLSVEVVAGAGVDEIYASSEIDVKAVKGGIEVTSNGGVATVYDLAGRILATEFVNGTATIATRPGACIVRVVEGNRSAVNKVIVK
ncbi:MAG: hypothetical protein K2N28_09835 [Muribaculaceae bacterium]|nr:hypothetical protein [Muribaculaceae bacterium]